MNESETRAELIDPALKAAGWGKVEHSRVRREVIAPGRLQGAGQRSKAEVADYVLTYRGHKLAVIEAKRVGLPDTSKGIVKRPTAAWPVMAKGARSRVSAGTGTASAGHNSRSIASNRVASWRLKRACICTARA